MMKRVGLILMPCAVFAFTSATVVADDLETIEKKITQAWQKHKSMTAKMKMVSRMAMGEMVTESEAEGTYELVREGKQVLFRMDLESKSVTKTGDQEIKSAQQVTTICDGEYVYSLGDTMGQKMATKMKPDPKGSNDPGEILKMLRKDHELKLLPAETIDGQKVHVIEAIPKKKDKQQYSKMLYYLREDGIPAKQVTYDTAGKPMTTFTYTDIKVDVKIDPRRFVFKAPEGVEVMDMTSQQP